MVQSGEPDGMRVRVEDGPPTPPPVRRRRRRRRIAALAAAVLVVAVPVGLALAGGLGDGPADGPDGEATGDPGEEGADPQPGPDADGDAPDGDGPDADAPGDGPADDELPPAPDPDELAGRDAALARLLVAVDTAERIMIAFQDGIVGVLRETGPGADPGDLLDRFGELGAEAHGRLRDARTALTSPPDGDDEHAGLAEVREAYVVHLDAWAEYVGAVADEPTLVLGEGRRAVHTLEINRSADEFARVLAAELDGDVDAAVRRFAEAILERGFRAGGESTV